MSSGTGCWMISLNKFFAKANLAIPKTRLVGLAFVPPELGAVGYRRTYGCFAVLIFVDQPNTGVEEPIHLVAEAGLGLPAAVVTCRGSA